MKIALTLLACAAVATASAAANLNKLSKVRTIEDDSATKTSYSPVGTISKPSQLLDGVTPKANWIWDSGEENPLNYYLHVRKSFSLEGKPEEAIAYVSAYAFAELYINGTYIDRVPTNPDPAYQTYERIDLTPFLREGINTIAALVYNAGCGLFTGWMRAAVFSSRARCTTTGAIS